MTNAQRSTTVLFCPADVDWTGQRFPGAECRGDCAGGVIGLSGGRIFLTCDRERTGAKEILFASFTEEDLITGKEIFVQVVSKP